MKPRNSAALPKNAKWSVRWFRAGLPARSVTSYQHHCSRGRNSDKHTDTGAHAQMQIPYSSLKLLYFAILVLIRWPNDISLFYFFCFISFVFFLSRRPPHHTKSPNSFDSDVSVKKVTKSKIPARVRPGTTQQLCTGTTQLVVLERRG